MRHKQQQEPNTSLIQAAAHRENSQTVHLNTFVKGTGTALACGCITAHSLSKTCSRGGSWEVYLMSICFAGVEASALTGRNFLFDALERDVTASVGERAMAGAAEIEHKAGV